MKNYFKEEVEKFKDILKMIPYFLVKCLVIMLSFNYIAGTYLDLEYINYFQAIVLVGSANLLLNGFKKR